VITATTKKKFFNGLAALVLVDLEDDFLGIHKSFFLVKSTQKRIKGISKYPE
jgi:hypothetical protein